MSFIRPKRLGGIIFDLDGTLIDSMHVWCDTDRRFLAENGHVITPEVSQAVQKITIEEAADYFICRFNLSLSPCQVVERIEHLVADEYFYNIPLKPYVLQTLSQLKSLGIPMCIATATYPSLVSAAVNRLGLGDYVDFTITCDEVGAGKQVPDIFLACAQRLNADVDSVIVVEDSLHAIETAVRAGFFTAAVFDDVSAHDWDEIEALSNVSVEGMDSFGSVLDAFDQMYK